MLKKCKLRLRHEHNRTVRQHYDNVIQNSENVSRDTWRIINSVTSKVREDHNAQNVELTFEGSSY